MSEKRANIKDWMLYVEDDKTLAFDITSHESTDELRDLCREAGIPIIGYVAFEHEVDARRYGDQIYR